MVDLQLRLPRVSPLRELQQSRALLTRRLKWLNNWPRVSTCRTSVIRKKKDRDKLLWSRMTKLLGKLLLRQRDRNLRQPRQRQLDLKQRGLSRQESKLSKKLRHRHKLRLKLSKRHGLRHRLRHNNSKKQLGKRLRPKPNKQDCKLNRRLHVRELNKKHRLRELESKQLKKRPPGRKLQPRQRNKPD